MERKYWLDNVRWSTVLLVLVYHVFYIYNGVGIPGGIPGSQGDPIADTISSIVYPWFMVLLFLIAGLSARYALQRKTKKQFIKERATKLLIPSTLGLFVIHWVTGYLNIKLGGGLEHIPSFLVYPISVISGTGPLWFAQMLFVFSCVALLFPSKVEVSQKWHIPILIGSYFLIWGSSRIGNLPVLTMYRFGIYFTAFAIGYFLLEGLLEAIVRLRIPLLIAALVSGVAYTVSYYGSNFTTDACLQSWLTNLYAYTAVLSIIAWASKCWNKQGSFSRYMSRNSYGFYVLHYPVLMVCCYLLHVYTSLPMAAKYAIAMVCIFVITWAVNEAIKRIPVVRYLVLGMKKGRKA